jgi:hypothetical protein
MAGPRNEVPPRTKIRLGLVLAKAENGNNDENAKAVVAINECFMKSLRSMDILLK